MKKLILTSCALIGMFLITTSFTRNSGESVTKFLIEAADARLMDAEEGKLARERGTTEEIRSYGRWMMRDQSKLLQEIQAIAKSKNVKLPSTISEEKSKGLEDLKKVKGEEFDKKFTKMIFIDHKRDVKEFKKAIKFNDAEVKQFASQYLPTIEAHLERIQEIQETEKGK